MNQERLCRCNRRDVEQTQLTCLYIVGAKGKVWEDKGGRQQSDDGSRGGNPSWMAAEADEGEAETSLLEQRRNEVEAERKAMQVLPSFPPPLRPST